MELLAVHAIRDYHHALPRKVGDGGLCGLADSYYPICLVYVPAQDGKGLAEEIPERRVIG